ncbi:hypothetical protein N0B31_05140 [Salinirubellus salinus]|jgi:hypothetical protein|uniref:Uncharacterized protein n=1 Tax=Salinirubellus salinus TaxID=1364945 RepID=A0A9E7R4F5_9EURY|nr:hypothetical protein [Salinirubellus salinus]UWM55670.1 hypothetical protein N0B31_05140 [Salinirubellus salinus]
MDARTRGLLRDGVLALVALAGLGGFLRRRGETATLRSPGVALVGVVGAVALEAAMLRYPERTRDVWERREVQFGSLLGLLVGGSALARRYGPWTVAACWWGLVAYLGLLACVLAGRENPVAALAGERIHE